MMLERAPSAPSPCLPDRGACGPPAIHPCALWDVLRGLTLGPGQASLGDHQASLQPRQGQLGAACPHWGGNRGAGRGGQSSDTWGGRWWRQSPGARCLGGKEREKGEKWGNAGGKGVDCGGNGGEMGERGGIRRWIRGKGQPLLPAWGGSTMGVVPACAGGASVWCPLDAEEQG